MPSTKLPPKTCRSGQTLLELIAAGMLLAATLVPALRMMRDGLMISSTIETRGVMTNFCVSKLDERLAHAAENWTNATVSGNFASEGYTSVRYSVQSSDAPANGGVVGRLMAVTSNVWQDSNGNSAQDAGELSISMSSKVAKMAVYQDVP